MSRIEAVDAFFLERPADALSPRPEHCFLLRLVTEDGHVGWGEGHGSPFIMQAAVYAPVTHVSAQGLIHLLRGADAADVPALRRKLDRGTQWVGRDGAVMQAVAAAELALWDLAGKRAGLPVARLLSARPASQVRAYASGKVAATPEATHARLALERSIGFDAFKIGWPPFGSDEAGDIAFLEAARDAVGPLALMADAAQSWSLETAVARLQRFAGFGLEWIEEPLERDDLPGQAKLRALRMVPVAAGEGECSLRGLDALLSGGCVDVLQPDATRCGLLVAAEMLRRARCTGRRVASHSFTTALNVTVHLHLLAQFAGDDPHATLLEWPVSQLGLWADLFPQAPRCAGGRVAVPEGAGWGLRPDLTVLERLTVPTPFGPKASPGR